MKAYTEQARGLLSNSASQSKVKKAYLSIFYRILNKECFPAWTAFCSLFPIFILFLLAVEKATKDLQEVLAEYYNEAYKDSMFTYDTEELRVDLSEIYVPIRWKTREKCTEGVTEKKLNNYRDILHKVSLMNFYYKITLIIL